MNCPYCSRFHQIKTYALIEGVYSVARTKFFTRNNKYIIGSVHS